jgi:hypothetical protein
VWRDRNIVVAMPHDEFRPSLGSGARLVSVSFDEAKGNMDDERIPIVELAHELQVRKQRIFKLLKRLGISPIHVVIQKGGARMSRSLPSPKRTGRIPGSVVRSVAGRLR